MFIHLLVVNNNKRILFKYLKQSMILLNTRANLAKKTKTHYETLGISPTATYNEIKSAYYELSLRYHPDKNKTESAKEMFQEISNAYDILSKYDTRKQYDRTIQVKYGGVEHTEQKVKTQTSGEKIYRPNTVGKIYDFDEWFQQHYSDTLKMSFKEKERQKEIDEIKKSPDRSIDPPTFIFLLILFGISSLVYDSVSKFIKLMTSDPKDTK